MNNNENHIYVIFGASGDLTKRKLIPALYSLYVQNLLPEKFVMLGVSRTEYSDDEFSSRIVKFSNLVPGSHEAKKYEEEN